MQLERIDRPHPQSRRDEPEFGAREQALKATGVADETLIIVAAKHGQTPVARALRKIVADTLIPTEIDSIAPNLVANATEDDIGLIWLDNQDLTAAAADKIRINSATNQAKFVLWGLAGAVAENTHVLPGWLDAYSHRSDTDSGG
ncbi:MAG TPA: hypothetical protein VFA43_24495 [Gemmatimonadaceae bacterium]|nr:hypothetical protein [Gemmatimonadaceae bacterium]